MAKILLVGCGKMGQSLAYGWLDQGRNSADIWVVEPARNSANNLVSLGIKFFLTPDHLPPNYSPNVVLFAVKPQVMDNVVPMYSKFANNTVFMSIAAGKTTSYFENLLGIETAIVRVMPNTPASVGRGISCAFANTKVNSTQRNICNELLEAVSETHWLESESQINVVTAISGSGPAYVFLLAESLAKSGKKHGLPKNLSERLGRVTVSGSGELLHQSGEDIVTLRKNVTSPGGTTEAALKILQENDALEILMDNAIEKALQRSEELAH